MGLWKGNSTDSESSDDDQEVEFHDFNTSETVNLSAVVSTRETQKELRRETNSTYIALSTRCANYNKSKSNKINIPRCKVHSTRIFSLP
jgi:hypothetical protein